MKPKIMFIENKSDLNDRGEAWIGKVEFSKTGQTVYFNGKSFKKLKSGGIAGNFYDLETGHEYWISGIKKNGQDRHRFGGGKINIEDKIIEEYLSIVDFDIIDKTNFEVVSIPKVDKSKFKDIENESFRK